MCFLIIDIHLLSLSPISDTLCMYSAKMHVEYPVHDSAHHECVCTTSNHIPYSNSNATTSQTPCSVQNSSPPSKESLGITWLPRQRLSSGAAHPADLPTASSTPLLVTSSHFAQSSHRPTPMQPAVTASLQPQSFPSVQFTLKPQNLLPLLPRLSLSPLSL